MIPSELYKAADVDEEEMNSRYFKHRQVPLAPHEKKVLSKKKKDDKYSTKQVNLTSSMQKLNRLLKYLLHRMISMKRVKVLVSLHLMEMSEGQVK